MDTPARPHRRLIWKYTAVVVALVAAATLSVGLTELYFTSRDIKRAVTRVEQDKASTAAITIEQLTHELIHELDTVAQPTVADGRAGLEERNQDFQRLLEHEELISQLSYVDSSGRERVRTSPLEPDRTNGRVDRSATRRIRPRTGRQAVPGPRLLPTGLPAPHEDRNLREAPGRGVVVADVDLSSVSDIIERARVGTTGYAYAVDGRGVLVTHPEINLVLRRTNFASLPQVRAALDAPSSRWRDGDGRP